MLWFVLVLLVAATVSDLRYRLIPDAVPLALLAAAVCLQLLGWANPTWLAALAGALLALSVGALLFWRGAFGGGDVKVIAALGALLGPAPLLHLLFWTALAGGAMAIVAILRGTHEVPYLPALTAGFVAAWLAGGLA